MHTCNTHTGTPVCPSTWANILNEERDRFFVLLEFPLQFVLSILVLIPGPQAVIYCGELSPEVSHSWTCPGFLELVMLRLEDMVVGTHS